MDAVVDRFVIGRTKEKAIKAGIAAGILVGDGLLQLNIVKGASKADARRFYDGAVQCRHTSSSTRMSRRTFSCSTTPRARAAPAAVSASTSSLIPSCWCRIRDEASEAGCFVREAFKYNPDTWDGRMMYSLAEATGFSLDMPWKDLSAAARQTDSLRDRAEGPGAAAAGCQGEARRSRRQRSGLSRHRPAHRALLPPLPSAGRGERAHGGVARQGDGRAHLPRLPRRAHPRDAAACSPLPARPFSTWDSSTSTSCTPCWGPSSLSAAAPMPAGRSSRRSGADSSLLLGIGLDYLSFNRKSGTLSGGESQRIRLSTQIGSGLMGMLYVLDEPSIGLHPKDNVKMIATLERLRDIGNTVIVVEHDEDTIRAADHIVEMGPGPGVHGGTVVVQGTIDDVLGSKASPTGQFLSGKRSIAMPKERRRGNGQVHHHARRTGEQPEIRRRRVPARAARRDHRRLGFRQEHAGERDSLQGAVEAPGGHAGTAGRARSGRWDRAGRQGRSASISRRLAATAAPILRPTSASTTRFAICSRRRRSRSSAATRRGASASTSKAVAARNVRAKGPSRRSCISCPTSR